MPSTAAQPTTDLVAFEILIDGKSAVTDTLESIEVSDGGNDGLDAQIALLLGFEGGSLNRAIDRLFSQYPLRAHLEIRLGRGAELHSVFKGVIIERVVEASQNSSPRLFIDAQAEDPTAGTAADPGLELTFGNDIESLEFLEAAPSDELPPEAVGHVVFAGQARATTGQAIRLKGLGSKIGHTPYTATRVAHRVENGRWQTTVSFKT